MLKIYRVEDTDNKIMYVASRFEPEVILTFHLGLEKDERSSLSFKSWGQWSSVELWDIPTTATIWGNMTKDEIREIYAEESDRIEGQVRKARA